MNGTARAPTAVRVCVFSDVADTGQARKCPEPGAWSVLPRTRAAIGGANMASPASIRRIVVGLSGLSRSGMGVPRSVQSIAAAAGSTYGSTRAPQPGLGQVYQYWP